MTSRRPKAAVGSGAQRSIRPLQSGAIALLLLLLLQLLSSTVAAPGRSEALNDGLWLVYNDEGQLKTESGAPIAADVLGAAYISMPHVMLAGQLVAGAPAGQVEEHECAAACRATLNCNVFQWCPDPLGCATSPGATPASTAGDWLEWRGCALLEQPGALPESSQPPKAMLKGADVRVTSGQLIAQAEAEEVPGYDLILAHGWFNMYDFSCNGSIKATLCMRKGSLQEAAEQCDAIGAKCMGFKWFPLGRDYLGPDVYMLKGVPDDPTPQNLPAVPIQLSLANWNGNVQYYAKNMTAAELAEDTAAMTWLAPPAPDADGGLSAGAIASIAVGCAAAAVAAAAALLFLTRRRRQRPVNDTAAVLQDLKVESGRGELTPADLVAMASSASRAPGASSKSPRGSAKRSSSRGKSADSGRNSADQLASELGRHWMVDVSQIKFVQDKGGQPTKLGSGAQGTVYKALLNGCETVAVKVIPLAGAAGAGEAGGSAAAWAHEARMLHGLRHRCVVHLVGVAVHGDKAMLITEFMDGRDLCAALSKRDASGERAFGWARRGKRVALDVASALAYLHQRHVMHFDVKSSNVMLNRDLTAKLGDVGLSKAMTHTFASQQQAVGTFAWCAPEVLQGKPCSYPADIYSFGVLLWEIVTGELPLRGRLAAPRVPQQCPQPVADLIVRCMQEDPNARPTAAQLVRGQQGAAGLACGSCRRGVSTHADWAG